MKIYVEGSAAETASESSNIEILCNKDELNILVDALLKFRLEIKHYVKLNKDKTDLGITHMHYQDYDKKAKESATDIVFYVDLNTYKE